ncbi:MAG: hypothetical protein ABIN48_14900 [Ginsengibacter sp.]
MKKILFAFVVGIIPSLALLNQNYAQGPRMVTSAVSMDQFFSDFNTAFLDKSTPVNKIDVNKKILKKFDRNYKVSEVKWFEVKDGIVANFISDGKSNNIFYDNKGHWAASLKSYTPDHLKPVITNMVKKEYPNYKIDYAHEIETTDDISQPTHVVIIQNSNGCKWIRINDGKMDVYKEFDLN